MLRRSVRGGRQWTIICNWRDLRHPQAGGAEAVCEEVAKRLAENSADVAILAARPKGLPRWEMRDGYHIRRAGNQFTVYPQALLWLLLHRRSVHRVIDSQNGIPFFSPLVVSRSTPVLLLLHHIHQEQFAKYFGPFMTFVGRWLESHASRLVYRDRTIVAVSPSTRHGARRTLKLRGDIRVIPPGVTSTGQPATTTTTTTHPYIVCVGRLVPHKRMDLLIRALPEVLAAHPDLRVSILGSGTEKESLLEVSDALGLSRLVKFHDYVDDETRDALLSSSWLTINPSEGEGWGLSVIEANALGVPALAFRVPGLRDSIRPGVNGWLIDEGSSLARGICKALDHMADTRHRSAIRASCRSWAQLFTWDSMATQLDALLEAERRRLAIEESDRRQPSDLAVIARVGRGAIPEDWRPSFRTTDRWSISPEGLTILLPGADIWAAEYALNRVGISLTGETMPYISFSIASATDHVFPAWVNPNGEGRILTDEVL